MKFIKNHESETKKILKNLDDSFCFKSYSVDVVKVISEMTVSEIKEPESECQDEIKR